MTSRFQYFAWALDDFELSFVLRELNDAIDRVDAPTLDLNADPTNLRVQCAAAADLIRRALLAGQHGEDVSTAVTAIADLDPRLRARVQRELTSRADKSSDTFRVKSNLLALVAVLDQPAAA